MRKHSSKFLFLLLCVCLSFGYEASAQISKAQKRKYKSQNSRTARFTGKKYVFANAREYVTLGVSMNALNYFGDITPKTNITSTDISFTRPGLGISTGLRIGPAFSVKTSFLYGQISSSDYEVADPNDEVASQRYARNLQFRNNIKELSFMGVLDLFPNNGSVMFRAGFTPYIFAGVSVFHHNPKAKVPDVAYLHSEMDSLVLPEAGKWVSLAPLHTEGAENAYSQFQISVPMGIGVRFRISQIADLEVETSYRYLFTDYIDDVSKNYVDKGLLESDLAKVMSDRSLEPVDVISGQARFSEVEGEGVMRFPVSYTGADGQQYVSQNGYGKPSEIRGSPRDNDIILVTSVRLIFIIGRSPLGNFK